MRIPLLISFYLLSTTAHSTNYYFSNDGSDQNQGTSIKSPYKTIEKLNSLVLLPGDSVFFRGGDTFYGAIRITRPGTSRRPIYIGTYNDAAGKAVITGFSTVSGWKSVGKGLFSARIGSLSTCNMVILDGRFQAVSKFPRGNAGYFNISKVNTGSNTITSNTTTKNNPNRFSDVPSVVGGEICWRPYHWVLWRGTVTSQTGTTITYKPLPSTSGGGIENPQPGYGFFLQDSPALCTEPGDWAYYADNHTLTMYLGNSAGSHVVQAATVETLLRIDGQAYVTIQNLAFRGANTYLVDGTGTPNITIHNCDLQFAGIYGIFANGNAPDWNITNNHISWCNSIGIRLSSGTSAPVITGNTITFCGAVAGMGGTGEGQYFGMVGFVGGTIRNNVLKHIGYIPISYSLAGAGSTVARSYCQYNLIDSFGDVKDDAGGIYCNGSNMSGSIIGNNIVLHGLGCPEGTPDRDLRTHGIYLDDGAYNLEISGNTVAFMGRAGIYVHNAHDLFIHHNVLWDNREASIEYFNDKSTIANITYRQNINVAKTVSSPAELLCYTTSGAPAMRFFSPQGLDSNYYLAPSDASRTFRRDENVHDLATWKKFTQQDSHSTGPPGKISSSNDLRIVINSTASRKKFSLQGKYMDVYNKIHEGGIDVPPFSSAVLISAGK